MILRFSHKAYIFGRMSQIRPIVMTGPSGTGKSTLFNLAMEKHPKKFVLSVSHTTRQPREGEIDGFHYHYVSTEVMEEMIKNDEFLEYAKFGKNYYGTSKRAIKDIEDSGRICIMDLELQGVRSIKKLEGLKTLPKFILIRAPSLEILEKRLRARGTETEESIQTRLKHAREDDLAAQNEPHLFDSVIVNDVLDKAYQEFLDAIKEELDAYDKLHSNGLNGH